MKRILGLILLTACFLIPPSVSAQVLMPFGGLVVLPTFCTCSFNWHVAYVPPHPVKYPWSLRALVLTPGITIPYAYQQFIFPAPTPTAWHLGDFAPGVQGCVTGIAPACVPVPADGHVYKIGSSYPGFTF